MKTKVLLALAALNVGLVGWVIWPSMGATPAIAQQAARPGEYILIPGDVVGGSAAVIYIIDETNRKLSARVFNTNGNTFSDMAPIDLDRVFDVRR